VPTRLRLTTNCSSISPNTLYAYLASARTLQRAVQLWPQSCVDGIINYSTMTGNTAVRYAGQCHKAYLAQSVDMPYAVNKHSDGPVKLNKHCSEHLPGRRGLYPNMRDPMMARWPAQLTETMHCLFLSQWHTERNRLTVKALDMMKILIAVPSQLWTQLTTGYLQQPLTTAVTFKLVHPYLTNNPKYLFWSQE